MAKKCPPPPPKCLHARDYSHVVFLSPPCWLLYFSHFAMVLWAMVDCGRKTGKGKAVSMFRIPAIITHHVSETNPQPPSPILLSRVPLHEIKCMIILFIFYTPAVVDLHRTLRNQVLGLSLTCCMHQNWS